MLRGDSSVDSIGSGQMETEAGLGVYNYPFGFRGVRLGGGEPWENVRVGNPAPDFTIRTIELNEVTMSEFSKDTYLVLEFGSHT
jgi:hypothetical protein